jgi:transcription elongation factor GreA
MANDVKRQIVTKDGLQKMIDELEYSKTTRRTQIAEQIKIAISFGDLSENAEYDAAKNEQAALEQRISELEETIRNAVVVDENNVSTDMVSFGNTVRVADILDGEAEEFTIVGGPEADPDVGRISNDSPVGSALLGARVGDVVSVVTPGGVWKIRVEEIR